MILFKSCPRCGGDLDATYREDVYCVQCSHRPNKAALRAAGLPPRPSYQDRRRPACPRCGATALIPLKRLRPVDNYCYRCQPCGHIFSPAARSTA